MFERQPGETKFRQAASFYYPANDLALFAVGLATLIRIGAGLYPAMRAAHMTTVLALKAD